MAQRFNGKVAVVLGGNSGIGLASAKAFANEGARVVITGRDRATLLRAAEEISHGAIAHRCDIREVSELAVLFGRIRDELGRIDVLFISAGVLSILPIESVTEADWDWVQDTNLKGVFFSVKEALPLLLKGSAIVLTGSTAAYKGGATVSTYVASKAGLRALGRALAAELLERGIRVNVVSPGPIETPIFDRTRGMAPDGVAALRKAQIECVPMKRMGAPEEVAAAVLYLASDDAAFVTGIDLVVDGGALIS